MIYHELLVLQLLVPETAVFLVRTAPTVAGPGFKRKSASAAAAAGTTRFTATLGVSVRRLCVLARQEALHSTFFSLSHWTDSNGPQVHGLHRGHSVWSIDSLNGSRLARISSGQREASEAARVLR